MKLCRYNDCADEYYPVAMPWDYVMEFKWKVKTKLFNYLDRDSKHAIICKIIHRHKKPNRKQTIKIQAKDIGDVLKITGENFANDVSESILDGFGIPWYCVRCGKEQKLKLMLPNFEEGAESYSRWKDYCKLLDTPKLIVNHDLLKLDKVEK